MTQDRNRAQKEKMPKKPENLANVTQENKQDPINVETWQANHR